MGRCEGAAASGRVQLRWQAAAVLQALHTWHRRWRSQGMTSIRYSQMSCSWTSLYKYGAVAVDTGAQVVDLYATAVHVLKLAEGETLLAYSLAWQKQDLPGLHKQSCCQAHLAKLKLPPGSTTSV